MFIGKLVTNSSFSISLQTYTLSRCFLVSGVASFRDLTKRDRAVKMNCNRNQSGVTGSDCGKIVYCFSTTFHHFGEDKDVEMCMQLSDTIERERKSDNKEESSCRCRKKKTQKIYVQHFFKKLYKLKSNDGLHTTVTK